MPTCDDVDLCKLTFLGPHDQQCVSPKNVLDSFCVHILWQLQGCLVNKAFLRSFCWWIEDQLHHRLRLSIIVFSCSWTTYMLTKYTYIWLMPKKRDKIHGNKLKSLVSWSSYLLFFWQLRTKYQHKILFFAFKLSLWVQQWLIWFIAEAASAASIKMEENNFVARIFHGLFL